MTSIKPISLIKNIKIGKKIEHHNFKMLSLFILKLKILSFFINWKSFSKIGKKIGKIAKLRVFTSTQISCQNTAKTIKIDKIQIEYQINKILLIINNI